MWDQLLRWWHNPNAPEELQHKIQRLMHELRSHDQWTRARAEATLSLMLKNANRDYTSEFALSLLEALAEYDHPVNLGRVSRCVNELVMFSGIAYGDKRVGVAAGICRERLLARIETLHQGEVLLRPSSPVQETSEILLRPAQSEDPTPREQLLRPSSTDEE